MRRHLFQYGVVSLCGVVLLLYPFWSRNRDKRTAVKTLFAVIGMALVTWSILGIYVGISEGGIDRSRLQIVENLKRLVAGFGLGITTALAVLGELFPKKNGTKANALST
jgi:uncharacterized membrane protein HdeD (DUF308 family)